jgi:hypothetical protein
MINSNDGLNILDETIKAIAKEFNWKNYCPKKNEELNLKDNLINEYIGTYKTESGICIETSKKDETLYLQFDKQEPLPLKSKNRKEFYLDKLNTDVLFGFSKKNAITKITIIQEGDELEAKKINPNTPVIN